MVGIEVQASVDRENAIYLTGETFHLQVSLRNIVTTSNSLAWGCVQLHCDQQLLRSVSAEEKAPKRADSVTSLNSGKTAIYSSKPTIIFCDVQLSPGEIYEYKSSFEIPPSYPPSFKGSFVKYSWYVTIAVQHVDAPFKMLQLPLRVYNLTLPLDLPSDTSGNPFLASDTQNVAVLDFARSAIDDATASRVHKQFNINNGTDIFATVVMFRQVFKLGDDIMCKIVFDNIDKLRCSVVTVRLESVEDDPKNEQLAPQVVMHAVQYCVTMFMQECYCVLSIPGNAVPEFSTDAARLRWRLHFEFLVSDGVPLGDKPGFSTVNKNVVCEKIPWDYYIQLYASNPFNVNLAFKQASNSVTETV
uniref:Arrestin_C domain-containing protein n=1 Tax=Panagrellus redivivus TaxID=6233 RepID=A0A7E4WA71_PANRE